MAPTISQRLPWRQEDEKQENQTENIDGKWEELEGTTFVYEIQSSRPLFICTLTSPPCVAPAMEEGCWVHNSCKEQIQSELFSSIKTHLIKKLHILVVLSFLLLFLWLFLFFPFSLPPSPLSFPPSIFIRVSGQCQNNENNRIIQIGTLK